MAYISGMKTTASQKPGSGHRVDRFQAVQAFNARLVCMTVDESSYQEVVNGVWKVLGCDSCALFLFDAARDELVMKAAVGYPDVPVGLRIARSDSNSMHSQAFREEYLIHVENMALQEGVNALSPDLGSNLVMPVISQNGPVGVFDFGSRETGTFDSQEIGMCSMLVDQLSYSLENIRLVGELSRSRDAVIRGMALLAEIRDTGIGGHLNRICEYARLLADKLVNKSQFPEVNASFVDNIARSAALHDVGKVGIPDSILLKPGKLTEAEYEIMKTHTLVGAELLEGLMRDFGDYAMIAMGAEVALSHHEWWDGTGYPRGLAGHKIPLAARILAICDVYDALTSARVYKKAWSQEDTIRTIRAAAGRQFDPKLVEIFFSDVPALTRIREENPR